MHGSPGPKYVDLAVAAAAEALRAAELPLLPSTPLFVGTNTGPRDARDWRLGGLDAPFATIDGDLGFSLGSERLAAELGLDCPIVTISTACSSGLGAVAHAMHLLSTRAIGSALCVGIDEFWYGPQLAYQLISAVSPTGCSPWGASDGTTMSEGAGALVLRPEGIRRNLGHEFAGLHYRRRGSHAMPTTRRVPTYRPRERYWLWSEPSQWLAPTRSISWRVTEREPRPQT